MIIREHKTENGGAGDHYHHLKIDWFDREWKILVLENALQKITNVHLWDNGWRPFDNRTLNEAIVFDWLCKEKIIKLKYKVQK